MTEVEPRVVSPERRPDDWTDTRLRPRRLDEVIGQERVRENLAILVAAAQSRGEPLDHVLFYGPPGLGKTTLAHVLANEMGAKMRITSGPAIERAGDLAAILTNLEAGDVLFIDEVHRLGRAVEEILYPAMEDFALDVPAPVISLALWMRFRSRQENSFGARLLAAMRQQFGGHAVRPAGRA